MKKLFLIIFVLVIVTPLAYCFVPLPYYSWNQKLTVEVEKDGKIYQASSVVKLSFHRSVTPHGTAYFGSVKGEAVVLELDKGQYLFALFTDEKNNNDYIKEVAARHVFEKELLSLGAPSYSNDKKKIGFRSDWLPYMVLLPRNVSKSLPRGQYPLLVTFKDIKDPSSVKQVDPEDMDHVFGCSSSNEKKRKEMPWRSIGKTWRTYHIDWLKAEEKSLRTRKNLKINSDERYKRRVDIRKNIKHFNKATRDISRDCYQLKNIKLEITNEDISHEKVVTILEWFLWPRKKFLDHGNGTNPMRINDNSARGYMSLGRTSFVKR